MKGLVVSVVTLGELLSFFSEDGWILTTGLNSGVAKLVGEAILQDRMLNGLSKTVISIGLTKWGTLTERNRELLSEKVK
jgi:hypothetical protein